GRLMELTGNNQNCDSSLPSDFLQEANKLKLHDPTIWYVWSYKNQSIFGQPVNLAEEFFTLLDNTKIIIENGCEVSILDLVETLLAHPEEVEIRIK
nr:hypothetical protein [Candidatus Gracilibacteria bacterium]